LSYNDIPCITYQDEVINNSKEGLKILSKLLQ
jgi:hypothetical protein